MSYFFQKVVWVTGASSGIGEALARQLTLQGAKLVISARRTSELERVKSEILHFAKTRKNASEHLSTSADDILVLPLDLEKPEEMPEKVEAVLQKFGKIDLLINNGGISQRSLAKDTDLQVVRRLMEVNYIGTVALSLLVLPHFLKQKNGHFAVVSSLVGKFGSPYRSAYSASKHALHGYFDSLRAEHHDDGIRVTMVCPGFIRTQISLNALTGDGSAQNSMDEATDNGIPPNEFAVRMLKAIAKGKTEVSIAKSEIRGVYAKRFFPKLFEMMIRKAKVR